MFSKILLPLIVFIFHIAEISGQLVQRQRGSSMYLDGNKSYRQPNNMLFSNPLYESDDAINKQMIQKPFSKESLKTEKRQQQNIRPISQGNYTQTLYGPIPVTNDIPISKDQQQIQSTLQERLETTHLPEERYPQPYKQWRRRESGDEDEFQYSRLVSERNQGDEFKNEYGSLIQTPVKDSPRQVSSSQNMDPVNLERTRFTSYPFRPLQQQPEETRIVSHKILVLSVHNAQDTVI